MDEILSRLAALEARADMALRAQVVAACALLAQPYEARHGDGFSYIVDMPFQGIVAVHCFTYDELADDFADGIERFGLTANHEVQLHEYNGYTIYDVYVRYQEVA